MNGSPSAGPAAGESARRPRLGVVIPLANEERTVEELLHRVLAQLAADDRVYCILDRKSRDGTLQRARELAGKDSRISVVWAPDNRYVVDAYFRGYHEALAGGCGWVLEMDGGMSHSPEQIPRFLDAMAEGIDFAAGSRFMRGGAYSGRISRYVISRGGTWISNLLLGTRMKDMTSGFECFSRDAMEYVLCHGVRSRAHFFQTEIRAMLHGWNWVEVPISYRNPSKRVGGENVLEAFRILWEMFLESRQGKSSAKP